VESLKWFFLGAVLIALVGGVFGGLWLMFRGLTQGEKDE
jgi:hypothetical protein